jgi:CRISPR-associated protein Csm1
VADRDGNFSRRGVAALGVLKGDIDDLGEIFRLGLKRPSFARHAALSRQVNAFFAICTPWILAREFPKVYTVFAGGDDFFLIGPWRTVQKAAVRLREAFGRYVAGNSGIHFSAGIATVKPGGPVQMMAEMAEQALGDAKAHREPGRGNDALPSKNAVSCFGQTVDWGRWAELEASLNRLQDLHQQLHLTTGYVYSLLQFVDMRQKELAGDAEAAMWRSRFGYRTRRFVIDRQRFVELASDIGTRGIEGLGPAYRIVLFNHLYQFRDR